MTVSELIERLEEYPQDLPVYICEDGGGPMEITEAEETALVSLSGRRTPAVILGWET